jgi:hypothetical protein
MEHPRFETVTKPGETAEFWLDIGRPEEKSEATTTSDLTDHIADQTSVDDELPQLNTDANFEEDRGGA